MLTRLKVSGFKNLLDVDVRFGPFTCIAGPNGVGKSNLMDAIRFLSLLSEKSLMEAASAVRDPGGRNDPRDLFYNFSGQESPRMDFEVEMIVPRQARDEFGTVIEVSATFQRYRLSLGWKSAFLLKEADKLVILNEALVQIPALGESQGLKFPHSSEWSDDVIAGSGDAAVFISANDSEGRLLIHEHSGRGYPPMGGYLSEALRTALSAGGVPFYPNIAAARSELRSWRLMQLEPSSLRRPDELRAPQALSPTGEHMPAALFRIASSADSEIAYAQLTNRLAELVGDVRSIEVVRDEARELLTLYFTQQDGTRLPARSLSDGTLRFLALAVLSMDPEANSLVCLEEPENGVHPRRIPAMIDLLRELAADPTDPDEPNPLRQVIFTTHSPLVVRQCPEDSVIFAHTVNVPREKGRGSALGLSCLPGTWREAAGMDAIGIGTVVNYLEPMPRRAEKGSPKRVIDRADIQMALGFDADEQEH